MHILRSVGSLLRCNYGLEQVSQLQNLKEDDHIGFSVSQKSGKVELTHRINEEKGSKNPRSIVTVPFEWKKDNKSKFHTGVEVNV